MAPDLWQDLEALAVLHLKAAADARWRKRMTYLDRLEVVREVLREGRSLGFVLRFGTRPVRPRKPTTVMDGHRVRLPRGGCYVNLAVRSQECSFHHFRVLVVFR